jgi:hypothetical protein
MAVDVEAFMIARSVVACATLFAAVGACAPPQRAENPAPEGIGFATSEFGLAFAAPRSFRVGDDATALTIDDTHLFWISRAAARDAIESVDLESGQQHTLAKDLPRVNCLTADRDDLYWCDNAEWKSPPVEPDRFRVTRETRMQDLPRVLVEEPPKTVKIMRASKRGAEPVVVARGSSIIWGLAVTPMWIYIVSDWHHDRRLERMSKDGMTSEVLGSCDRHADFRGGQLAAADDVYWSCGTELSKVSPDGKLVHVLTERSGYFDLSAGPRVVCWVTRSQWIIAAFGSEPPKVLAHDQIDAHVACSGDTVVWSNQAGFVDWSIRPASEPPRATFVEARSSSRPLIRFSGDDRPEWVVANDHYLGWYDGRDRAVRVLPRGRDVK